MSNVNNNLNIHHEAFCLSEDQFNYLKYRMRLSIAQILQIQSFEQFDALVGLHMAFPHYESKYELLFKSQKDFKSNFDVYYELKTKHNIGSDAGLALISPDEIAKIQHAPQLLLISDYGLDANKVLKLTLQQAMKLSDCAAQAIKNGATVETGVFFHSNTDCDLHSFADGIFVTDLAGNSPNHSAAQEN